MNYFCDLLINMNEEKVFNFYEWEASDPIELIKKIPIYRVSTKILNDFYLYNIKLSYEFLNLLLDKTVLKNNKVNKTIKYACLLCDTKNTIVVEFNDNGEIISRSNLLLDDESNVLELIYSYKEINLEYKKLNLIKYNNTLRYEEVIKKVIRTEFKTIIEKKDLVKLKYLFTEWFGYEENSVFLIEKKIKNELDGEISLKTKDIYNLIVLLYDKN